MKKDELFRKLYHLLGGLVTPAIYLFVEEKSRMAAIAGAILAAVLTFEILRLQVPGFRRWIRAVVPVQFKREEETRLAGQAFMQIGYLITILCFPRAIAIVAMTYLAVGDSLAAIVGKSFGRHKIPGTSKSVEGSAGCFGGCALAGFLIGCLLLGLPAWLILAGAAAATLFELVNLRLDDNLVIPVLTALCMQALFVFFVPSW